MRRYPYRLGELLGHPWVPGFENLLAKQLVWRKFVHGWIPGQPTGPYP